jgi:hypothetical protein
MVCAVKLKVCPVHKGEFAVSVGVGGFPSTLTLNVPVGPLQPAAEMAFTEYIPVASVLAPGMLVFWVLAVKPFGPVHVYDAAPATVLAVNVMVDPTQSVELPLAIGAAGVWLTVTATVPAVGLEHPATVATTEYTPAATVPALAIVGFCKVELKLFGPVQE